MFERRTGDRRRGDHYLHSSFADLVLSGLVGLYVSLDNDDERRGRATDDAHGPVLRAQPVRIVIDPLFETGQLHWFLARSIQVRGHTVDVAYDADGSRYSGLVGLSIWLDGNLAAHAETLKRLAVSLQ